MEHKKSLSTVIFVTFLLDQLTKWLAMENLSNGKIVSLFWTLQFRLVRNSGISFGKGEDLGRLISVVILIVILFLVKFALDSNEKKSSFLYGLIIGGAIGNLADRIFRSDSGFLKGKVVDFIDFQWWPVFNIADSAVVVGCLFLIFNGLRRARV